MAVVTNGMEILAPLVVLSLASYDVSRTRLVYYVLGAVVGVVLGVGVLFFVVLPERFRSTGFSLGAVLHAATMGNFWKQYVAWPWEAALVYVGCTAWLGFGVTYLWLSRNEHLMDTAAANVVHWSLGLAVLVAGWWNTRDERVVLGLACLFVATWGVRARRRGDVAVTRRIAPKEWAAAEKTNEEMELLVRHPAFQKWFAGGGHRRIYVARDTHLPSSGDDDSEDGSLDGADGSD